MWEPTTLLSLIFSCKKIAVAASPYQEHTDTTGAHHSKHPIILVVSFDGFRYDYFDKVPTPNMKALKASGVSVPYMEPVFMSKTFVNHQSIATGVYAETHGITDNTLFDPLFNKTLSGKDGSNPEFWNYSPDIAPIWIWNELDGDGRVSGCYNWPGCSCPYGKVKNLLPKYFTRKYNGSIPWEERVDTVISWITNPTSPANLVFLYFEQPDIAGHAFGPNSPEVVEQIRLSDVRTAYLVEALKKAGIFEDVNLIMLNDHGMEAVTSRRIVNITKFINEEALEYKYGGTPVLNLKAKEGKEEDLYNNLARLEGSYHYRIYKKEDLKGEPFHYFNSRRILDFVVVADPGWAFDDFYESIESQNKANNLTASPSREYGVHGYSNQAPSMRAFFLARGPSFKKGLELKGHIKNVDVVPLISKILGIPPPPNNGSLIRVSNMINA